MPEPFFHLTWLAQSHFQANVFLLHTFSAYGFMRSFIVLDVQPATDRHLLDDIVTL